MTVTTDNMLNENYEPGDREETILELLKDGRDADEPWGRVNPKYVTDRTGIRRQYVSRALSTLETAGWVEKVATGLYELVDDPRETEMSDSWMAEIASLEREVAREKFEDWCQMLAETHEPVRFDRRQDDIARLHIDTEDNHIARDLTYQYGGKQCPVRCIDVNAIGANSVELVMLLADLELHNPQKNKDT